MGIIHNEPDLADKFIEIVNQVTQIDDNEKARARIFCPDQSVGLVKAACASGVFDRVDIVDAYKGIDLAEGRIILVLESPHDKEYVLRSGKWIALGPAQGCTGCRIRGKFREIFNEQFSVDAYELILLNAIQYQCSLGRKLEKFGKIKDQIVQSLLATTEFQEDLEKRLLSAWRPKCKDFIVNVCSSNVGICCYVNNIISGITSRSICGVPHPFSWQFENSIEKACKVVRASWFGKARMSLRKAN